MRKLVVILIVIGTGIAGLRVFCFYPYKKMPDGIVIDKIVVIKSERIMKVYANNRMIRQFRIALGGNPVGAKQMEGDERTPEGNYIIFDKNPNSGWHKNLGISYPNKADVARNFRNGLNTGGDIKIHGLKNGSFPYGRFHRMLDWTNGCIALTNEEIDDLYEHTTVGTPILVKP